MRFRVSSNCGLFCRAVVIASSSESPAPVLTGVGKLCCFCCCPSAICAGTARHATNTNERMWDVLRDGVLRDVRGRVPASFSVPGPCPSTMDDGRWTMDHGPWTMDYGLWTMDHGRSPTDQMIRLIDVYKSFGPKRVLE